LSQELRLDGRHIGWWILAVVVDDEDQCIGMFLSTQREQKLTRGALVLASVWPVKNDPVGGVLRQPQKRIGRHNGSKAQKAMAANSNVDEVWLAGLVQQALDGFSAISARNGAHRNHEPV